MTYKSTIEKYLYNTVNMDKLTDITSDFVEEMKLKAPEAVERFFIKTDLVLNPCFDKETAEYAVFLMENRDGTVGEKWSYDETSEILENKGYKFNPADWYYVLNMKYSDEWEKDKKTDDYVKSAYLFLNDKDAPDNKAKRYFLAMRG